MSSLFRLTAEELRKIEADNRQLLKLEAAPVESIKLTGNESALRNSAEKIAMELLDRYGDLSETVFADCFRRAQVMSLQVGTTKMKNGKKYVLNENHRWTLPRQNAGQKTLFDAKPNESERKPNDISEAKADYKQNGVKSKAFKDWFGDWEAGKGSKVVDKQGFPQKQNEIEEPIKMYHGTGDTRFDTFSKGMTGFQTTARKTTQDSTAANSLALGPGFYFSDDQDIAFDYAMQAPVKREYTLTKDPAHATEIVLHQQKNALAAYQEEVAGYWEKDPEVYERIAQMKEFIGYLENGGDLQEFLNDPYLEATPERLRTRTDRTYFTFADLKLQHVLPQISEDNIVSEKGIKECYLNIRNPFDADNDTFDIRSVDVEKYPSLGFMAKHHLKNIHFGDDTPSEDYQVRYSEILDRSGLGGQDIQKTDRIELNQFLVDLGYDGIKKVETDPRRAKQYNVWVAFEPNQIKDVENQGTFDPENDSTKMSLQPGTTKNINGKTYVLNENHRWTLPKEQNQAQQPQDTGQQPEQKQSDVSLTEADVMARPIAPLNIEEVQQAPFGQIPPPHPQTLVNRDARQWYLHQESIIHDNIDPELPMKQKAQLAFKMRNHVREKARRLMHDIDTAKELDANEKHMTFDDLIERKKAKYGIEDEEQIYEAIFNSAKKSRESVNKSLGVSA